MRIQEIYKYEQYKSAHESQTREPSRGPARSGCQRICRRSTLSLRISNQQPGESTSSKHRNWTCRPRVVKNSPASDVMNAKWRAETSTFVSINLNQKHVLKIVSWAYTPSMNEASNHVIYRYDKTSCTGSVDRFMRLILRGNNPNKEPSSIYHIPQVSINWVHTTRAVHNNNIREQYESTSSNNHTVTKESV